MNHLTFNHDQAALFASGIVAHLVADWFLQNHWQSSGKTSLKSAAAYVHSGIHLIAAALVFPVIVAVLLGVAHLLIDTRTPLVWWGKFIRQSTPEQAGPAYIPFAMGRDQAAHLICIAIAAVCSGAV